MTVAEFDTKIAIVVRDDLAAWQRLLVNLRFADPRRSLAASRIAQLRADALGSDARPGV